MEEMLARIQKFVIKGDFMERVAVLSKFNKSFQRYLHCETSNVQAQLILLLTSLADSRGKQSAIRFSFSCLLKFAHKLSLFRFVEKGRIRRREHSEAP